MKKLFKFLKASLSSKLYRILYSLILAWFSVFILNTLEVENGWWNIIPLLFLCYPIFMLLKGLFYAILNFIFGR